MGIDSFIDKKKEIEEKKQKLEQDLQTKQDTLKTALKDLEDKIAEKANLEIHLSIEDQKIRALDQNLQNLNSEFETLKNRYQELTENEDVANRKNYLAKIGSEFKKVLASEENELEEILENLRNASETEGLNRVRREVSRRNQMIQDVAASESRELAEKITEKLEDIKDELRNVVNFLFF